ncbi:MAG: magnesium transporter [Leptospiraceae bacterium]|nr:magnesium transporter [Leptospiraceae bacterium]MCK6379800.1 magnesium transporter [Leptospiraceae bacterium]
MDETGLNSKIVSFSEHGSEWIEKLKDQIQAKEDGKLLKFIEVSHPADIADAISHLDSEDAIYLFRLCNTEQRTNVLVELNEEIQMVFVNSLNLKEISPIVENMESDDATSLFDEISPEKAEAILNSLDKEDSSKIRNQMNFEENSAGRLMTSDFAVVKEDENVRKGIINLRKASRESDNIYLIYVTDEKGVLKGFVKLKDLFLSSPTTKISKIMKDNIKSIHFDSDKQEVAKFFRKYDYVSAAVVDDNGVILGRITVDDILDIMQEEASKDILRLGGVSEDERLSTSIFVSLKRRLTWLNLNLVTAIVASSVVSMFEDTIQKIVVLASLMPIVAGMGGNAGTQAITIVVRHIATGDLTSKNWFLAIRKELIIGILNGIFIGVVSGVFTFIIKNNLVLSIVIGFAMFINLVIAGIFGSIIPIILKISKIDPAIASSIFVTTSTDIFGFFCFLGLASLLINFL